MQGFNMVALLLVASQGQQSGNQIHRKRAPGTLRKDGTQTVRFEMPYAVICASCKPEQIIGQGTRFNSEKQRVGNYLSTPIFSFRIKHQPCGGTIEIRTDPKNTAYVVMEGGKARDYGEDKVREGEGGVPIPTAEERERRREDAFAQLEDKVDDAKAAKDSKKRVEQLYSARDKDWSDPWSANRKLRASFRHDRKILKREEVATEALKTRLGTDLDLLPGTEQDAQRAKLVTFGVADDESTPEPAARRGLFERRLPSRSLFGKRKPTKEDHKEALRRQLIGNTRAAMNPFGGTFGRK